MLQISTRISLLKIKAAFGGWAEWLSCVLPKRKVSCSDLGVDKLVL
jgi:hypothetical protein